MLASSILLAQSQLLIGRKISPAGTNTEIGSLPMNIILSPDGKYAITSDMGFKSVLDFGRHEVRGDRLASDFRLATQTTTTARTAWTTA